jgi:hypothetical protein
MTDPIDMVALVRELPDRPRGRACLVLTHDYGHQQAWAAELAHRTDSGHLDLLERFCQDGTLADAVSDFLVPKLFEFLQDENQSRVLIVSGMEFLKAAWSGQAHRLEEFASRVENWSRTPCLVFVLQYDQMLADRPFRRFPQYSFVIDQNETLALS